MSKEKDARTKEAEARIMKVSELITDIMMATLIELPWSGMEHYLDDLNDALDILDPDAAEGLKQLFEKDKVNGGLMRVYEEKTGAAKFTIGLIIGFHLTGRTDLIPKFARFYAATADFPMEADGNEEGIPAQH